MTPADCRDLVLGLVESTLNPFTPGAQKEIVAWLRQLDVPTTTAAVDFMPLDGDAWRVGRFLHRWVPSGVRYAHSALLAREGGQLPPLIPSDSTADAVRKAIHRDAVNWARYRCPELVSVLKAVSVKGGTIVAPAFGLPKLNLKK